MKKALFFTFIIIAQILNEKFYYNKFYYCYRKNNCGRRIYVAKNINKDFYLVFIRI